MKPLRRSRQLRGHGWVSLWPSGLNFPLRHLPKTKERNSGGLWGRASNQCAFSGRLDVGWTATWSGYAERLRRIEAAKPKQNWFCEGNMLDLSELVGWALYVLLGLNHYMQDRGGVGRSLRRCIMPQWRWSFSLWRAFDLQADEDFSRAILTMKSKKTSPCSGDTYEDAALSIVHGTFFIREARWIPLVATMKCMRSGLMRFGLWYFAGTSWFSESFKLYGTLGQNQQNYRWFV